ncbi:hypothetical protein V6N13_057815 [Hibiscus sabdariffa]
MLCFVGLSSNASPNNLGLYASIKLLAAAHSYTRFSREKKNVRNSVKPHSSSSIIMGVDGKSINQNPSLQNLILRYFPSANNMDMISSIPFAMVGEIADASPAGE